MKKQPVGRNRLAAYYREHAEKCNGPFVPAYRQIGKIIALYPRKIAAARLKEFGIQMVKEPEVATVFFKAAQVIESETDQLPKERER